MQFWPPIEVFSRAHTKGSCNNTLLRKVLRRFFKGGLRRVLRRRLVRVSARIGVLGWVLSKGWHRRRLEGAQKGTETRSSQSTTPSACALSGRIRPRQGTEICIFGVSTAFF